MNSPAEFSWRDFPAEALRGAKQGRTVSVCLPARNEAATVGDIVSATLDLAARWDLVDEVLVVDDGSTDDTAVVAAAAGATVCSQAARGKGGALQTALNESKGDIVLFCDADIVGFETSFVTGLLGPLLLHDHIGFVKARYERPGDGGRVTQLVARPVICLLFPHLAAFAQPLAGEFGGRRDVLERVPFVPGYGVDLGLLVDVVAEIGLGRVAQVDLGRRVHRNRPLAELAPQAEAVLTTALARAGLRGPDAAESLRGPDAAESLRGPDAAESLRGSDAAESLRGSDGAGHYRPSS